MKKTLFYNIMNYPIPIKEDFFYYDKKSDTSKLELTPNKFSRTSKSEIMEEYIEYIKQYKNLYRSIPFVQDIYLCNSITFNALKQGSDIDIFIITKKKALWRARFFSVLYFRAKGLKRTRGKHEKKFCLTFYTTEDNLNLQEIALPGIDIYLVYRLAHLVSLYQEIPNKTRIYDENKRIKAILPNHPLQHCINIGIDTFVGNTKTKKKLERIFSGIIGFFFENLIKSIRSPIVIYKKKRLGVVGENIVINSNMLKFYKDIRKKIRFNFFGKIKDDF